MSGRSSGKRKSKMDGMLSSKRSKLIVCQGTDGSIQTRKEELDAVNSDHDYIQTPPTEEGMCREIFIKTDITTLLISPYQYIMCMIVIFSL